MEIILKEVLTNILKKQKKKSFIAQEWYCQYRFLFGNVLLSQDQK